MKISVITASYNYSDFIKEAIKSVLCQTHQDWELIVVDDGSSDNSIDVIKSFCGQDERIKLFTHENNSNKGLKETLLLGIEKAESDWVAFLESDDIWREDYLEKKIEIAEKFPEVSLIFNDTKLFGDEKKILVSEQIFDETRKFLKSVSFPRNMFKDLNVNNRIFTFSSVMVKKEVLLNADFNTPCDKLLDWWLYIDIAYKEKFYYIPEKLTLWRFHPESYINNKKLNCHLINLAAYYNIYRKNKKQLWLLFFIVYSFILNLFKKFKLYKILFIRKIKTFLGMPLKNLAHF